MNRRDNQPQRLPDEPISRLASDKTSGAAEILRQAGAVFTQLKAASPRMGPDNLENAQQAVLETCIALASAQPDMTPLLRLASAALSAARTASDARDSLNRAEEAALNFISNAARWAQDASLHAATLIRDGETVLTHSRSSTVLAAFIEAKRAGRNASVVVTESRPMLEGRTVAATLVTEGVSVTLIADAAASLALDRIDSVILGADQITPVNLVNKIGTRLIALAVRERGLPLYAVCDSSKFIDGDYFSAAMRRSRDSGELWPDAPRGVTVVNSYFEPTPLASFTGVITEDGVLSISEAARRAGEASVDMALVRAVGISLDGVK